MRTSGIPKGRLLFRIVCVDLKAGCLSFFQADFLYAHKTGKRQCLQSRAAVVSFRYVRVIIPLWQACAKLRSTK